MERDIKIQKISKYFIEIHDCLGEEKPVDKYYKDTTVLKK